MNNLPPMATRATQKQLAYLAYWQKPENGGYTFGRDAVIPESTLTPPAAWNLPRRADLLVSAAMLAAVLLILKVAA